MTAGWTEPVFAAPKAMTAIGPGGLLLFDGAITAPGLEPATWLWNRAWSRHSGPQPLPNRTGHGLAYDTHRHRAVLFGGTAGFGQGRSGALFDDTWEWTGTQWLKIAKPDGDK